MLEVKGKFNTAKIYTDVVDQASINQVLELCNQEFTSGSRIRLMPDIHAGAGCTIGTTMTITDKIVPNLVGVDIGCGMEVARIKQKDIDFGELDDFIRSEIPSGFSIRTIEHGFSDFVDIENLRCASHVDLKRAKLSLGTLGGGNHFIEVDKDDNENIYVVIHSGSRHLGVEVANYYQNAGYKALCDNGSEINKLVERLKQEGRQKDIQTEIQKLKLAHQAKVPKQLAYVSGQLFDDYIHDMKIVQEYAKWNRMAIMSSIAHFMDFVAEDSFTTVHNYIDTDSMILRKGAVSAKNGEILIIPINMRDGSLICVGKGNEDWNHSAPHGAGRLMSRTTAKEMFSVQEFKEQMANVYTTSVDSSTLDECPMAYKKMSDIVGNIGDTVDVLKVIKPVYNFKAGEG